MANRDGLDWFLVGTNIYNTFANANQSQMLEQFDAQNGEMALIMQKLDYIITMLGGVANDNAVDKLPDSKSGVSTKAD